MKHLGNKDGSYAVYSTKVDKTLLDKIPRDLGRIESKIENQSFVGDDVWNVREMTFLLQNGLPIAGTLKIVYSSISEYMVESKSLKLYLNTFDMTKMGTTLEIATYNVERRVQRDLENILETNVFVSLFFNEEKSLVFKDNYKDIFTVLKEEGYKIEDLSTFDDYTVQKSHLKFQKSKTFKSDIFISTNILRSRCEHTFQKDSGHAFFHIITEGGYITTESLLRHIVSLREKAKFHENCCEKLVSDISKVEGVVDCMVMLLYARRGGIDINPVRATREELIPKELISINNLTQKLMMQ